MGTRLSGKLGLITGAARGLGAFTCKKFLEEDIEGIIITDIKESKLNDYAKRISQVSKAEIIPIVQDVTKQEDWEHVLSVVEERFGKLDILVNNAGGSKLVTFEECTLDYWNEIISLNLTSTFLGMKLCLPLLKKSGEASIVNISSVAGLTGYFIPPYTASKWAVRGITKAAAMEFSKWNIRVNSVHPGYVWTPLTERAPEFIESFNKINPMERVGVPEEVGSAIVFLASKESSYMNGTEMVIDGGLTAGGGFRMVLKEVGIY